MSESTQRRLTRAEVPVEETWNVDDIFETPEAWETEFAAVKEAIKDLGQYEGRLGEGPGPLLSCLEAQEELYARFMRVGSYARLHLSTDATSPENQAAAARVASLGAELSAATAFFRSEALALPEGTLENYLDEEPGLADFRRIIERMVEEKPYMLNPETEQVLASLDEVLNAPGMIYGRSKAADMTFEPVTDSKGNELPMSFAVYEGRYQSHEDFTLRRNAWESFTEGLKAYKNTYAATWATEVKKNVALARLRGFESAIDMILFRQEVTREVYDNLHDIILTELAPHMRRYAALRKQVLGLDTMLYCDLEAPLDPDYAPSVTFEEAGEILLRGLAVMGDEYLQVIRDGLNNRWIDRPDNVGKSTGAFCNSVYGVHPYVLITWTGSMRNAFTLAHELGHAGQGVMSQRYQRLMNTRPTMFFIEAPSTINEIIVGTDILSRTNDPRMRRWVSMQFLATYHHNFVRHLIEGELQRRIYTLAEAGRPITETTLSQVQGDILAEFWGDILEIDDGARLTWMRQPHYYRGLYPYTYSAGLTIGTAVGQAIREEGQPAVERWLEVLKAGGTRSPIELAEMAGVDMTKPDPIREAVAFVGSLVDEVVQSFESR